MRIFMLLTIFLLVFTCILHIGCGEDEVEVEIANFIGIACVNGKVEIRFDAKPTDVFVEHMRLDRIVNIRTLLYVEFDKDFLPAKVEDNKIIATCEKSLSPDIAFYTVVRWGQPSQERTFECPCK